MSILTNRHFVIAMIVAPILAIIAWFGVDKLVAPPPVAAQPGQTFELIAKPNCRYDSGHCELVNGDVKVMLEPQDNGQLKMLSNQLVQVSRLELLGAADESLQQLDFKAPQGTAEAMLDLSVPYSEIQSLRIAFNIEGTFYYAETGTKFLENL